MTAPQQDPGDDRAAARRAATIKGFRDLADFLEVNPQMPVPVTNHLNAFAGLDEIRAAMHLTGPWRKSYYGDWAAYVRDFGGVELHLNVSREQVCRKVQTGVKVVEAHEEPVYDWVCGDSAGDDADEQVAS